MDYNATIAIAAKAVIGILLALGGIAAIFKGVELYRDGVGKSREETSVEVFNILRISTSTMGAVLMLTASGWGWLATRSLNQYSGGPEPIVAMNSSAFPSAPVKFAPTQAELSQATKLTLDKQATWLKTNPSLHIAIDGIATKADGSLDFQNKIAEQRADNVKSYLVNAGVSPDRISTFRKVWEDPQNLTALKSPSWGNPSAMIWVAKEPSG